MRTIKFLGFVVALTVAALPAQAQGGLQPGAFPGIDRLARVEARRLEQAQHQRQFRGERRMKMAGRFGQVGRASRAGRFANATPEQKAFATALRQQRQSVHAQVLDGKLTREQARAQMQAWVVEHRPKK